MSAADQFLSEPLESSSTAEDTVTVGTHHADDVISASAHTEPTTEAPTPTTPACIDVAPDESISMDDLLTETVHQVDPESAALIHLMETDPALWSILARKWCSIGCELVQSYVGTEMEYIRILQGKESQTGKLLIQLHCTLSRYIFKITLLRAHALTCNIYLGWHEIIIILMHIKLFINSCALIYACKLMAQCLSGPCRIQHSQHCLRMEKRLPETG